MSRYLAVNAMKNIGEKSLIPLIGLAKASNACFVKDSDTITGNRLQVELLSGYG